MKVAITGAAGSLGRQLVPLLQKKGIDLVLVERERSELAGYFADCESCDTSMMVDSARGCSTLLHLSDLNKTSEEPHKSSLQVDELLDMAGLAHQAGIKTIVNFSSVKALDGAIASVRTLADARAESELEWPEGLIMLNVYLPHLHDPEHSARHGFLGKFPIPFNRLILTAIASFRPTVSIERIADFVECLDGASPSGAQKTIILSDGQSRNLVFTLVKRTLDLVFATAIAVFFWWLLFLIWALVRIESKGSGIFAQERVGKDGNPFVCYKFRTMKIGTANLGTHEVSASSVTKLGAVLRKLKLDELPQIINIFRNDISLIGPRPCLPVQQELIEARRRLGVLALKPGISGLAQVNGIDMSDPEKLAQWDARYVALQSLLLDLKIIIATALGSGNGDRVSKQ